ncbi:hypothetical protein ACQPZK_02680 [Micromonospora sp. CA-249363]|uniref:hypothetical protein n=1 Tax=Micromonospora sp. CA-249363 TaxID=3239963 RepID=UPI003D900C70
MSSVALIRPARWAVLRSLRELTRLAVTALVLAVGLGGALAATPPPAEAHLRPTAVSSRVDTVRPEAAPTVERTSRPVPAPPADRDAVAPAGPILVVAEQAPAGVPVHGTPPRRGPPAR